MKSNHLFRLYVRSLRRPFRLLSPSSFTWALVRVFLDLYLKTKGIREGVKDEGIRYCILEDFEINIGKHTYGYLQLCQKYSKLKGIGAFCSIGAEVKIVGVSHPLDNVTTSPILYSSKFGFLNRDIDLLDFDNPAWDIYIGNDVYIGQYVKILPGVNIGDGAVVGAGSIVTKNVPPYAIIAGVPAKVIRYRFSPDVIDALKEIKWWEWDDEKIFEFIPDMLDVEKFIKYCCRNRC